MKIEKQAVLKALENISVPGEGQNMVESGAIKNTVSYTHLTLPTTPYV